MSTAVRSVRLGIDAALLADTALDAIIDGRLYADASKPENAPIPFISYGTPSEGAFDTFGGKGNDGARLLHLYGHDEDQVEAMYEEVERVLGGGGVTTTGHAVLRMSTSLLSIAPDPSGAAHGVVRVAALTQAT